MRCSNLSCVLPVLSLLAASGSALGQGSFRTIAPDAGFDYAVIQDVSGDGSKVLVSLQNSQTGPSPLYVYTLDLATNTRVNVQDPFGSDLIGLAMNADGSVVVGSLGGGPLASVNAFVWRPETGVINISGLPNSNLSYAVGVSADGNTVVGSSGTNFGDPYQQGWRLTENGLEALEDINNSSGDDILLFSTVEGVSADGQTIFGTGATGDFDPDTDNELYFGALWQNGSLTPTNIGNMPAPFPAVSSGYASSSDGSVIIGTGGGFGPGNAFVNRAFRWTQAGGYQDLGSLPGLPQGSTYGFDCSADGNIIVGSFINGGVGSWEAFVWTPDRGMRSLRQILANASITIPANIRLRETFTDDAGRVIAGWAYNTTTQRYLGYVATLPLACEYDFNRDENIDLTDAQQMAQVFVGLIPAQPTWLDGDLNGDENADLTDAQLLAAFVVTGVCPI
jgi:hypothetical protein